MADAKQKDKAETKTPKKDVKNGKEKEPEMVRQLVSKSIQRALDMLEYISYICSQLFDLTVLIAMLIVLCHFYEYPSIVWKHRILSPNEKLNKRHNYAKLSYLYLQLRLFLRVIIS